jgi:hypothetical protein
LLNREYDGLQKLVAEEEVRFKRRTADIAQPRRLDKAGDACKRSLSTFISCARPRT